MGTVSLQNMNILVEERRRINIKTGKHNHNFNSKLRRVNFNRVVYFLDVTNARGVVWFLAMHVIGVCLLLIPMRTHHLRWNLETDA